MPEDPKQKIFPKSFLWGASTSSHQVEGGNTNQWSEWEKKHAADLAHSAEKRLNWIPIWDEIKHQAKDPNNYISGKGIEHYQRYKEDFDIAKKLNLKSLRFSVEWSRIEPEEGVWDYDEIKHYKDYIAELTSRGLEPVMNIWHWTNPIWFEKKGAFKKRANVKYFLRFVRKVSDELGRDIKYILVLNEPNVYCSLGYLVPDPSSAHRWPPEQRSILSFLRVYFNLIRAHNMAYEILKKHHPHLQISSAVQIANIQAKDPHDFIDGISTKIMRYFWDWFFIKRINKKQDFIGMNYYFTDYYDGIFKRTNPKVPLSDLGWYMEPEGLYPILSRAWERFKKPIIITETGVADHKDQYRQWWIEETIVAMERAISQGVDVRGYFYWSLLDNFEWAMGWWPNFGLVEVDRQNDMKRTIRPSAKWYAERIDKLTK